MVSDQHQIHCGEDKDSDARVHAIRLRGLAEVQHGLPESRYAKFLNFEFQNVPVQDIDVEVEPPETAVVTVDDGDGAAKDDCDGDEWVDALEEALRVGEVDEDAVDTVEDVYRLQNLSLQRRHFKC